MMKPRCLFVAGGKEDKQCEETTDRGYDCDGDPAGDHALVESGYAQNGQWSCDEMNGVQCATPVVPFVFVVDYGY